MRVPSSASMGKPLFWAVATALALAMVDEVAGFLLPVPSGARQATAGRIPSCPTWRLSGGGSRSYVMESVVRMTATSKDKELEQRGHLYGYGDPNHKPSILQEITAQRYRDVEEAKQMVSEDELRKKIKDFDDENGGPVDLFDRICAESPDMAVAAEFKRASPSKGNIAPDLIASEQGSLYASAGAAVLSVLTEPKWFKGTLGDMRDVRLATQEVGVDSIGGRPAVLRKDFIVDEYQVLEARANGADTVLLIVAILEKNRLESLMEASRKMGMEPLVEVHTNEEMQLALAAGAKVIGVNNRNLHTFELDLATTERIAVVAAEEGSTWQGGDRNILLCALSGITGPEDVERFDDIGVSMVLVGETLMRAKDPSTVLRTLKGQATSQVRVFGEYLVKVCGVTRADDALVAAGAGANMIGIIFAEASPRRVSIEEAKEIVEAVQSFGERSSAVEMERPQEVKTSSEWFTKWSEVIIQNSQRTPLVVGVFQNQPMDEVLQIVEEVGLDMVQLHGNEGIEACGQCGVPGIHVLHVPSGDDVGSQELVQERAAHLVNGLRPGHAATVLLDTSVKGAQGGTGVMFDHDVARLIGKMGIPVIVAGGLVPSNVAEVVTKTRGWGVDVSSGVEAFPREKNDALVQQFVAEARRGQAALENTVLNETSRL